MICCVTGHRPEGFPFPRSVTDTRYIQYRRTLFFTIEELILDGYDHFITGMAEGVDQDFARFVLQHKAQYPHILLEAALPYPFRASPYAREAAREKASILSRCDIVREISPVYYQGCMQKRNIFMVDKADLVLAVWNGTERGGTWNTIRYARQKERAIQYIRL